MLSGSCSGVQEKDDWSLRRLCQRAWSREPVDDEEAVFNIEIISRCDGLTVTLFGEDSVRLQQHLVN